MHKKDVQKFEKPANDDGSGSLTIDSGKERVVSNEVKLVFFILFI
jgi:hypothetical protein